MTDPIGGSPLESLKTFNKSDNIEAETGAKLARKMGTIENDLMSAFLEEDNSDGLVDLAKKYNLFPGRTEAQLEKMASEKGKLSSEAVIQGIKMKYDKLTRALQAFLQVSRTGHETMMATIRNMRLG